MRRAIKLTGLFRIHVGENAGASEVFYSRFVIVIAAFGPQVDPLQRPNNLLAQCSDVSSVNGTHKELNHGEFRFEVRFAPFLGVMRFVYVEI
jgi:hypothetical protein